MKNLAILLAVYSAMVLLSSTAVTGQEASSNQDTLVSKTQMDMLSQTFSTLRRRLNDNDDEDDDDEGEGDNDDDDDDEGEGDNDDDDDDDEREGYDYAGRRNRKGPMKPRSPGDSSSVTNLRGVLRIVVYGDGDMCFVKIFQRRFSYRQQYGDTTNTSAFLNLYGHGECEDGAVGVAYGVVKAGVMAEAHRRGTDCEAKVTSFVIAETRDLDPNDGVSVMVGGAAGGEALAVCP